MSAYVLSVCVEDAVTIGLRDFTNGDKSGYFRAFGGLCNFAATRAVTDKTIKEYLAFMILDIPNISVVLDAQWLTPYWQEDIRDLFELYFSTDWDTLIREHELLPIPSSQTQNVSEDYKFIMDTIVCAQDADDLRDRLTAFCRCYSDTREALHTIFNWDGQSLNPAKAPDIQAFEDIDGLDYQKNILIRNTNAFLQGKPYYDMLLAGGDGTGKSACLWGVFNSIDYSGARLVTIRPDKLDTIVGLVETLSAKKLKYIVFADDLLFDKPDNGYYALRTVLDGGTSAHSSNTVIYAATKLRGLDGLASCFGERLVFSDVSAREYLKLVKNVLENAGYSFSPELSRIAKEWAITYSAMNRRGAKQFAAQFLQHQSTQL